jgi:hypothetical protein
MEATRSMEECGVKSLRDYPAALRYTLRAENLTEGKNPAVLGYLAEACALNGSFPKAVEAAERGVAVTVAPKAGEPPSRLRQWLLDELKEYKARMPTSRR